MTFYEERFPRSILSHLLVIRIWMINDPNDNIQNYDDSSCQDDHQTIYCPRRIAVHKRALRTHIRFGLCSKY